MIEIVGEKVILRPMTVEDTNNIICWRNNYRVRHNFVFQEDFTKELHLNWIQTKIKSGEAMQYIIMTKDREPIGSVYFRDISKDNQSAEFGIFIGNDCARGMGYGTEATKLFVKYGFEKLCFHRIMLRVFEDNIAAIRSYKP